MAAIVASTLRRRTFRQKLYMDAKFQALEQERIFQAQQQQQLASSSRSSSIADRGDSDRRHSAQPPIARAPQGDSRGVLLNFVDFWPSCVNSKDGDVRHLHFDTFDTLIPKANAWLHESVDAGIVLKKCETLTRVITSLDDIRTDTSMTDVSSGAALCLTGLRLWFTYDDKHSTAGLPVEIGYINVIPKVSQHDEHQLTYEQLPDTYTAINSYLNDTPLLGKIITIETVVLRLPESEWTPTQPNLDPDKTFTPYLCAHHVCHVTRIFFITGAADDEIIGAQDFLPEFNGRNKFGFGKPRYGLLNTAVTSLTEWITSTTNIRLTNIQTLETLCDNYPDGVNTGLNFLHNSHRVNKVKFVRATFVRPRGEAMVCESMYCPPSSLAYRTFLPAPVKVHMCSGTPEYETLTATWDRAEAWVEMSERQVVAVETAYHPLSDIWHRQDRGETMVTDWGSPLPACLSHRHLVQVIRVYLDGRYTEPDASELPPLPAVHEVNDCSCNVM